MDLSTLRWVKVITDDDKSEWAYTRDRLKAMHRDKVIDMNEVTIFPLAFRDQKASEPDQGSLITLIQRGKLTHLVEVLDKTPYSENNWFHRLVKVIWWQPNLTWENLPPQSQVLGFDPTLMDGKPHLLCNLKKYRERWENDGGIEAFKLHFANQISMN